MVLCAATALLCLGGWLGIQVALQLGRLPDRLAAAIVPSRAVATIVLGVVGFVATPRPVAAEPVPPLARLAEPVPADPKPEPEPAHRYEVVRGDSLWRIAQRRLAAAGETPTSADVARYWPRIYEANRSQIGDDPNLILPGQQFDLPEIP